MLTFVTGLPGHSKTLYTVSTLSKEYEGRDIYYHGIDDLKLPWIPLDEPEQWYRSPDAAVIIMDEAQRIFPARDHRKAVPEKCSHFETHRHQGLDIILITQNAKLIDHHVRNLCGRHIHVVRARTGNNLSMVYTAGKIFNPQDKRELNLCEKTPFKFPKAAYQLYKSAEVHTVKTHYPLKLFAFPALLIALFACIYILIAKVTAPSVLQHADEVALASPSVSTESVQQQIDNSLDAWLQAQLPRVPNVPSSAPKYDHLTEPKTYPRPLCVARTHSCDEPDSVTGCQLSRCQCYTQQITKLDIDAATCQDIVENGYFDESHLERPQRDRNWSRSTKIAGR